MSPDHEDHVVQDFRRLIVWTKAHEFALGVCRVSAAFPAVERYGLTSQLRRAAASIPMNISEACGRNSDAEYVQSLQTSFSSGSEAEYQLLLARDLGYVDPETHQILDEQVCEVKRILAVIMRTIRRRLPIRPRSRSRLPDSDAPPSTPDA